MSKVFKNIHKIPDRNFMDYAKFQHFRILFFSLLSIWIFFISILVIGVYINYRNRVNNDIESYLMDKTNEIDKYTEDMVVNLVDATYSLVSDINVHNVLYSDQKEPIIDAQAISVLKQVKNIYPYISSVGVYNSSSNRYFTTNGIFYDIYFPTAKNIVEIRVKSREINTGSPEHVTTIYIYFKFSKDKNTFISYDIDTEYMNNKIGKMNSSSFYETEQYVLSDGISFSTMAANEGVYADLKESRNRKVYTSVNEHFEFITVANIDNVLIGMARILYLVIFASIVFFIIGFVLLMILARKIYRPIASLLNTMNFKNIKEEDITYNEFEFFDSKFLEYVNKVKYLEKNMAYLQEPIRKSNINRLILGGSVDIDEVKYELSKYFTIINVYIDSYSNFVLKINNEQNLYYFIISNVIGEFMEEFGKIDSFYSYDGIVKFLLYSDGIDIDKEIHSILRKAIDMIKTNFSVSLSVTVGENVVDIMDLNTSYRSAVKRSNELFFKGMNAIILNDYVRDATKAYPKEIEIEIIKNIKLNNEDKINENNIKFMEYLKHTTYFLCRKHITELIYGVISKIDIPAENYMEGIDKIEKEEYFSNVKELLNDLFKNISIDIFENSNKGNFELVEKVKEYILSEYENINLNTNEIADVFKLSTVYLGKIFKTIANTSISDFINLTRLEKAKELISSTDKPIARISEEVGISNSNYFYTLFKKKYGMTPTEYRSTM
ncbi:MAG: helix-turn-helix domain-containing protein [Lachnospirales bacterium]